MRIVADTNVIIAAIRNTSGASSVLLQAAADRRLILLGTPAVGFEYEEVCLRPEQLAAANLSAHDMQCFVDGVIELIEPVQINFMWRPQLEDADDEMILEAAVNGRADAIATFDRRHLGVAAKRFAIEVLSPGEIVRRLWNG